jgi:hypothetical protein
MVKALTVSVSVLTGVLIGRIQIIENHDAKDAIANSERVEKRLVAAKREATRTRALLDKTERQVVSMWRRLEPMLEDFTKSDSLIDRDAARLRIQSLRWEMASVDATITASREAAGDDERTAMRQAYVKQNFGD